MNFKNFTIILALLSFKLKVFSIPVNGIASEVVLSAVEISDSEVEVEVESDEFVTEDPYNDSDSELETTEVPTDLISDKDETSDLPCNDIQSCINWMKENREVLTSYGTGEYDLSDEVLDNFLLQYQDEKNVENLQNNYEAINYGIKVDVNGRKMSVNIMGEEHDKTIVVLPGLGISSPVIFYRSLTNILANDFKVVTVEPFGYGLSDLTDEERTAENIASEINTCLHELGIDQFYFMGHSIGGIYSLVYDNIFEGEVLGFIGLDNTPSNMDSSDDTPTPEVILTFAKILNKYHLWGFLPEDQKKELMGIEQEQQYQNYSEEEVKDLLSINSYRFNNPNIIDESNHTGVNVALTKDMYFHCPLLMFISEETQTYLPEWKLLHENMINNNPDKELIGENSKVVPLKETTHGFIHTQKTDDIYNEIKEWIN